MNTLNSLSKKSGAKQFQTGLRPSHSANLPNETPLPPNFGYGDPSLTPEGGGHMVLRKNKVEIGNSCSYCWRPYANMVKQV
jgi:hypothetical protein